MLCAQALARVSQAMSRLPHGQVLEVFYNADDVKGDLLAWAQDQGHEVWVEGSGLRLQRTDVQ